MTARMRREPLSRAELEAHAEEVWAERERRVAALRDRQLEEIRQALPLSDPDRHDLDTVADASFARLAPGYPNTCDEANFNRSVAASYVALPNWSDPAPTVQTQEDVALLLGLPDCDPTPAPARDVQNVRVIGGAL